MFLISVARLFNGITISSSSRPIWKIRRKDAFFAENTVFHEVSPRWFYELVTAAKESIFVIKHSDTKKVGVRRNDTS